MVTSSISICTHGDVPSFFACFLGRCAFGIDETDLQSNSDNIYFKKTEELFDDNIYDKGLLLRAAAVIPEFRVILGRLFSLTNNTVAFIDTRLLPLISTTIQLNEMPITWLLNRLHTIVELRRKKPIQRVDLLQLLLQATTNETIEVIR